ncbi:MAG: T9SS type A sorting domain-containing protein [Candidatus Hodarchaeales archaeon]
MANNFGLESVYPNPFNSSAVIRYSIDRPSEISISVYNIVGEEVESIVNGYFGAGKYENVWNACEQSSGVYFSRIIINGNIYTKKMTLLK